MSSYSDFAFFYDSLMNDVDYKGRSDYLLKLFSEYGKKPELLLDLACGTGGFSNQMAQKGIEVIGVDISEEMLGIAREKSYDSSVDVLYLCQDAAELDLYGTIDGAICCMDSLNHITDIKKLEKAISKVSLFLEKDSLFIFDVNTPFKHEHILGNNTFVIEEESIYCVWQNEYDAKKGMTYINLDFFAEKDGVYERYSEEFCERAYSIENLCELVKKHHFDIVGIFDDLSENPLREDSERAIFVLRKNKETNGK